MFVEYLSSGLDLLDADIRDADVLDLSSDFHVYEGLDRLLVRSGVAGAVDHHDDLFLTDAPLLPIADDRPAHRSSCDKQRGSAATSGGASKADP